MSSSGRGQNVFIHLAPRLYSSPSSTSIAMLSVKRPRPWVCCAALYSLAFSLCSTLAQPKLPWSSDHASALDTRTMRETHDVTDSVSASQFDSFHGLSLRAAADSEIGTDISLAPVMKIASNSAVSQNVTFSQNNVFDPRRIQVVSFDNPRSFIYKSFLSTAECDFLIEYAKPSMHKSGVVDADSGNSLYSEIRTSTGSFIPSGMNRMVQRIESRIATWSQIQPSHGEPIQVLRYQAGQEYQAHYDYFFHESGLANNRVATVLMYLSDVRVRT